MRTSHPLPADLRLKALNRGILAALAAMSFAVAGTVFAQDQAAASSNEADDIVL